MKNGLLGMIVFIIILMTSCISLQDREMTSSDLQLQVLGNVSSNFTTFHFLHIQIHPIIKNMAYNRLMDEAKKKYASQYGADVLDIKNIIIEGDSEDMFFIGLVTGIFPLLPVFILCDWQTVSVTGTVVVNPNKQKVSNNQKSDINTNALEKAVEKIGDTLVGRLPGGSTIAVLSISGTTRHC